MAEEEERARRIAREEETVRQEEETARQEEAARQKEAARQQLEEEKACEEKKMKTEELDTTAQHSVNGASKILVVNPDEEAKEEETTRDEYQVVVQTWSPKALSRVATSLEGYRQNTNTLSQAVAVGGTLRARLEASTKSLRGMRSRMHEFSRSRQWKHEHYGSGSGSYMHSSHLTMGTPTKGPKTPPSGVANPEKFAAVSPASQSMGLSMVPPKSSPKTSPQQDSRSRRSTNGTQSSTSARMLHQSGMGHAKLATPEEISSILNPTIRTARHEVDIQDMGGSHLSHPASDTLDDLLFDLNPTAYYGPPFADDNESPMAGSRHEEASVPKKVVAMARGPVSMRSHASHSLSPERIVDEVEVPGHTPVAERMASSKTARRRRKVAVGAEARLRKKPTAILKKKKKKKKKMKKMTAAGRLLRK